MADSDGSLPVSREELGLDPLEDNQEEEQETSSGGEGSPSPQQDEGSEENQQEGQQGDQLGGEDPDPDDPPGGSSKDDEGSHPSSGGSGNPSDQGGGASRHSGSPLGSLSVGVTNPILRQKFEQMEARAIAQTEVIQGLQAQVASLVAVAQAAPAQKSAFQGVKLRPKDPLLFSGEDKKMAVKDWLATVKDWLDTGSCDPDRRVPLAQTFLSNGAASYWRARNQALKDQGVMVDFALFAKTLESGFGHQDPEQNARDKLEALSQTGSVEDYASRFQSLSAEIVTLPLSEGDKIQRFRNGLKTEMQTAAGIDPMTGKRWMDLGKFIDFACSVDATRAQAGKQKGGADSGGSGKSSVSYKEKLQNIKRTADSSGGPPVKKGKFGKGQGKFSAKPKGQDAKQIPLRRL